MNSDAEYARRTTKADAKYRLIRYESLQIAHIAESLCGDNHKDNMVSLQERKFADFRFNNEAIRKDRKPLESTNCHQFVPYSSFSNHELPRFMDITNNEKRVYLKHQFNLEKENKLRHEGADDLYTSYDSKKYLDLGVAPLQRIINDLRSISSHSTEDLCDHRAAKASGLVGYGEYLQGAKHPARKY